MKININRNHFTTGLQRVLNIVGNNLSMPILNNVLIEAKENGVHLTTTNLDQGICCHIQAQVSETGKVALPVRKLASIVRELPNLEVTMEGSEDHQVKLISGGSRFRISGMSVEDFPPLPDLSDDRQFTIDQDQLLSMLKNVSYARSLDQSRYILNSILFQFLGEDLTLVATDGRRLALVGQPRSKEEGDDGHLVLPGKTADELERLLSQGKKIRITFNDRQVAFNIEVADQDTGLLNGIYLVSKILEGEYPDYKTTIMQNDRQIKIDREILLDGVHRAALVATDRNYSVLLNISDSKLEITSKSPEYGECHESVAIQYEGETVAIGFNPDYLLDPLRALTKDEVILEFKDEFSPTILRTLENFLCVIMPLRLN